MQPSSPTPENCVDTIAYKSIKNAGVTGVNSEGSTSTNSGAGSGGVESGGGAGTEAETN